MNMTSPTGDATMLVTGITRFCSHTDKSKVQTRWRIKATGLNETRGGRMLVLRYQEKMQMRKQCRRTTCGTGMNPTGRYAHMFEERGEKEIYPNDNRDPYKEE